ncbi:hypothetical protein H9P43_005209 [Blastocladiella emersonii ATCC 22665]|nr:hypothetical protein H9P43_005209 [Blastocladiella emersonii ATCC 22665]
MDPPPAAPPPSSSSSATPASLVPPSVANPGAAARGRRPRALTLATATATPNASYTLTSALLGPPLPHSAVAPAFGSGASTPNGGGFLVSPGGNRMPAQHAHMPVPPSPLSSHAPGHHASAGNGGGMSNLGMMLGLGSGSGSGAGNGSSSRAPRSRTVSLTVRTDMSSSTGYGGLHNGPLSAFGPSTTSSSSTLHHPHPLQHQQQHPLSAYPTTSLHSPAHLFSPSATSTWGHATAATMSAGLAPPQPLSPLLSTSAPSHSHLDQFLYGAGGGGNAGALPSPRGLPTSASAASFAASASSSNASLNAGPGPSFLHHPHHPHAGASDPDLRLRQRTLSSSRGLGGLPGLGRHLSLSSLADQDPSAAAAAAAASGSGEYYGTSPAENASYLMMRRAGNGGTASDSDLAKLLSLDNLGGSGAAGLDSDSGTPETTDRAVDDDDDDDDDDVLRTFNYLGIDDLEHATDSDELDDQRSKGADSSTSSSASSSHGPAAPSAVPAALAPSSRRAPPPAHLRLTPTATTAPVRHLPGSLSATLPPSPGGARNPLSSLAPPTSAAAPVPARTRSISLLSANGTGMGMGPVIGSNSTAEWPTSNAEWVGGTSYELPPPSPASAMMNMAPNGASAAAAAMNVPVSVASPRSAFAAQAPPAIPWQVPGRNGGQGNGMMQVPSEPGFNPRGLGFAQQQQQQQQQPSHSQTQHILPHHHSPAQHPHPSHQSHQQHQHHGHHHHAHHHHGAGSASPAPASGDHTAAAAAGTKVSGPHGHPQTPTRSLWIGNLDTSRVGSDELMAGFAPFGAVESLRVLPDKDCAFVNYFALDDARRARAEMQGHVLGGQPIKIGFGKVAKAEQFGASAAAAAAAAVGAGARGPGAVYGRSVGTQQQHGGFQQQQYPAPANGTNESAPSPSGSGSGSTGAGAAASRDRSATNDRDHGMADNNTPSRALWVGNLPPNFTVQQLSSLFANFGAIESCRILTHKNCGFVNYLREADAIHARRVMHGRDVGGGTGFQVRIGFARVPTSPPKQPSGVDVNTTLLTNINGTLVPGIMPYFGGANGGNGPVPNDGGFLGLGVDPQQHQQQGPVRRNSGGTLFGDALDGVGVDPDSPAAATQNLQDDDISPLLAPTPAVAPAVADALTLDPAAGTAAHMTVPHEGVERRVDQAKVRELRRRLDAAAGADDLAPVFEQCLADAEDLSLDYAGNTVLQRLIERINAPQLAALAAALAPALPTVAVHKHGTWVVQKLMDGIHAYLAEDNNGDAAPVDPTDAAVARGASAALVDAITPYLASMLCDPFGNYVVQSALKLPTAADRVFAAAAAHIAPVAQGRFGARALRACLEAPHATARHRKDVAAALLASAAELAPQVHGALLFTWLIEASRLPGRRAAAAAAFIPCIVPLATSRTAAPLVYKLVAQAAEPDARDAIVRELFFGLATTAPAATAAADAGKTDDAASDPATAAALGDLTVLDQVLADPHVGFPLVHRILATCIPDPAARPPLVDRVGAAMARRAAAFPVYPPAFFPPPPPHHHHMAHHHPHPFFAPPPGMFPGAANGGGQFHPMMMHPMHHQQMQMMMGSGGGGGSGGPPPGFGAVPPTWSQQFHAQQQHQQQQREDAALADADAVSA